MSASLLNLAAQPNAQPGVGQGIAGQAAQAQQAQGPLVGFEALLAALFGDQGVGVGVGDPNAPGAAGAAGGKTTGKGLLGGKVVSDGGQGQVKAGDAEAAVDPNATATPATTTPDATLALLVPAPTAATTVQTTAPAGEAADAQAAATQAAAAGAATDKAAEALAKLTAATSAQDATVAKDATALAQQAPTQAAAAAAAQSAKAQAAPAPAPQLAGADGQPVPAATPTALDPVTPAVLAQSAPVVQAQAGEPAQPVAPKDKTSAAKPVRVEGARAEGGAPTPAMTGKAGDTNMALAAASAGKDASDEERSSAPAAQEARPQASDAPAQTTDFSTASTTTPATLLHAAALVVRGAPQTVANLAAQIAKKLEGRSTRFDLQLDPAGLGKVDVRMEIAASGKMSAALTFDTPQAAAELRARAGELQRALEQAGFDLTGGMSFDVATDRGQGGRGQDQASDNGAQFRGRAFQTALDTSSDAALTTQLTYRRASAAGVDIRI